MIAEQLKTDTKEAHQSLEKLLIPRIKKTATKEEYTQLLGLFYGYYHPLEQLIEQHLDGSMLQDITSRRKAGWLLSDMAYMAGGSEPVMAQHMPHIANAAQAFGALYVMEGSALGGKIIKKMLQANLGMNTDDGFDFFNGYGDDTGKLWAEFIIAINDFEQKEQGSGPQIIAAANDTFNSFRKFLEARIN